MKMWSFLKLLSGLPNLLLPPKFVSSATNLSFAGLWMAHFRQICVLQRIPFTSTFTVLKDEELRKDTRQKLYHFGIFSEISMILFTQQFRSQYLLKTPFHLFQIHNILYSKIGTHFILSLIMAMVYRKPYYNRFCTANTKFTSAFCSTHVWPTILKFL